LSFCFRARRRFGAATSMKRPPIRMPATQQRRDRCHHAGFR
jgi:hypothetical protein